MPGPRLGRPPFLQSRSLLRIAPPVPLVKPVRDVTRRPLLTGKRVTPLVNGNQAYPAMRQGDRFRAVVLAVG